MVIIAKCCWENWQRHKKKYRKKTKVNTFPRREKKEYLRTKANDGQQNKVESIAGNPMRIVREKNECKSIKLGREKIWKVMEICYFGRNLFECRAQMYGFMLWAPFHQQQNGNHIWCHFYFRFEIASIWKWCWKCNDGRKKKWYTNKEFKKMRKLELKLSEQQ